MATETTTPTATPEVRHEGHILTGRVTSAKMEKTIVVEVLRLVQHPKYRRVVRISPSQPGPGACDIWTRRSPGSRPQLAGFRYLIATDKGRQPLSLGRQSSTACLHCAN